MYATHVANATPNNSPLLVLPGGGPGGGGGGTCSRVVPTKGGSESA